MLTRLPNRTILYSLLAILTIWVAGCDSDSDDESNTIIIGGNFEITGSLPDVGRHSRQAAEMFVEEKNADGGVVVGGNKHLLELVAADNQSTGDGAVAATTKLVNTDKALVMVGPNPSNAAVPAGGQANTLETVMISPWSTNPNTTLGRPWVFRAPFLDTFQGPVLAHFAAEELLGANACIMHDPDNAYPHGIALSFREAWIAEHGAGSVHADETFSPDNLDVSEQLGRIIDANCHFLFLPQYAHEVSEIVKQAHELGIDVPVLGSDSWGSAQLLEECGAECNGYFFSTHYIAKGATGITKAFIDRYEAKYGETPNDVAALTWDAMGLVAKALQNCGTITGNLVEDRTCVRDGMAEIENFHGITGAMTFNSDGDPIKCAQIVRIQDGDFSSYGEACP